jgi:ADP-heptose:LPS heptosyltransferase
VQDCLPKWQVDAAQERWAEEALAKLNLSGGPLVGFAPASRRETRRWPAKSYAALGKALVERQGARLLVFWGPGEKELAAEVAAGIGPNAAVSPETPGLGQLAALIGRLKLLVTNCNGPKHIAVARGVPTVTIHGSSDPAAWNPPFPERHPVARLESLHCIGCRLNDCPYNLECMRDLGFETVFQKARILLEKATP